LILGLEGCQKQSPSDGVTVDGKVLLDGKPVERGTISLVPQPGLAGPSGGAPIQDGTFTIPAIQKLMPGDYRVEVTVIPKRPENAGPAPTTTMATDVSVRQDKWGMANPPRTFRDPAETTVLKSGKNEIEIDLKSGK